MDAEAKKFLGNLWAGGASHASNRQTPEAAGIDRSEGWDLDYEQHGTGKYPERLVWNQIVRELQGGFQEKLWYGFPRWAADVTFAQWSWVQHDEKIWVATQATGPTEGGGGGEQPGSGSIWRQF